MIKAEFVGDTGETVFEVWKEEGARWTGITLRSRDFEGEYERVNGTFLISDLLEALKAVGALKRYTL